MAYIHGLSFQLRVFFQAAGLGLLLGPVYGILRFVRLLLGNRCIMLFDILFSLTAAFASFCFILAFNDGMFRTYVFAGEALGFFSYYFVGAVLQRKAGRFLSNKLLKNNVVQRLKCKFSACFASHKQNKSRKRCGNEKK